MDPGRGPPFWTGCRSCCHVHLYDRAYLGLLLHCPHCRHPFRASELASPPRAVPSTDTYYCSWGFFPLGYPGCPMHMLPTPPPSSGEREQPANGREKDMGGGCEAAKTEGSEAVRLCIDINEEVGCDGEDDTMEMPNITIDLEAAAAVMDDLYGLM